MLSLTSYAWLRIHHPSVPALATGHEVTDDRVYAAISEHAFDEAVAWPSQALIARKLGISRYAVNRSCARLRAAGKLTWTYVKRPGRWHYNRYELLAAYAVSTLAAERITKRAHRHSRAGLHTNRSNCVCGICKRSERTQIRELSGPNSPSKTFRRHLATLREFKREHFSDEARRIMAQMDHTLSESRIAGLEADRDLERRRLRREAREAGRAIMGTFAG